MQLRHGVFAAVLLAGCATTSTELVNSWKDPSAPGVQFKKVLTVCACKDDGTRRTVEDRLAAAIKGSEPSYSVLSDDQLGDRERTKAALRGRRLRWSGHAAARQRRQVSHLRPGVRPTSCPWDTTACTEGGAMAATPRYGAVYDPGYVREDQLVNFDTNIYRVEDEKLLWASRSQTTNPSSVNEMIDDIIAETVKEMKAAEGDQLGYDPLEPRGPHDNESEASRRRPRGGTGTRAPPGSGGAPEPSLRSVSGERLGDAAGPGNHHPHRSR